MNTTLEIFGFLSIVIYLFIDSMECNLE